VIFVGIVCLLDWVVWHKYYLESKLEVIMPAILMYHPSVSANLLLDDCPFVITGDLNDFMLDSEVVESILKLYPSNPPSEIVDFLLNGTVSIPEGKLWIDTSIVSCHS
jgi:hypothetical protein